MTCGGCSGAVEKVLGKLGGEYFLRCDIWMIAIIGWFETATESKETRVTHPLRTELKVVVFFSDKVQNVQIDLDAKKVFVTSAELSADELLEKIQKTGKQTTYVGFKSA